MDQNLEDELYLLRRLAEGRDEWDRFFDFYGPVILSKFRRMNIKSKELRNDAMQELAIRLIRNERAVIKNHLENYQNRSFKYFVGLLASQAGADVLREAIRHSTRDIAMTAETSFVHQDSLSKDPAKEDVDTSCVEEVLRNLTRNSRDPRSFRILYLRFYERWRVKDIANHFGLEENTVAVRIHYYIKKCREMYGDDLADLFASLA